MTDITLQEYQKILQKENLRAYFILNFVFKKSNFLDI